ncbi:MAG: hypothetical protein MUF38_02660 [Anaerolineae bacterium]|jgi:prefoldin subunit 5|nr:hypothetical protein [Anaerolineae bacterium]
MDVLNNIGNALNDFVTKQPFLAIIMGSIFGALVGPIFGPYVRIIKNTLIDWWTQRGISSLSARIQGLETELASVTKYYDNPELLSRLFQSITLELLIYIGFGLFIDAILIFMSRQVTSIIFITACVRAAKVLQIYKNVETYQTYKFKTEEKLQALKALLKQRQIMP